MSRMPVAAVLLAAAACAAPRQLAPAPPQMPISHSVAVKDYTPADGALIAAAEVLEPEDLLLCGLEQPTGTHVAHRICRSQPQLALVHQQTQDWLRITRSSNGAHFAGGGERAYISP